MKQISRLMLISTALLISPVSYGNTMGEDSHNSCSSIPDSACTIAVKTRYGEVKIIKTEEAGYNYKLLINGKEASTFNGESITIEGSYSIGNNDNLLISVGSGGSGCPMEYYIVQVEPTAAYKLSASFGTCSDYSLAKVDGDALVVTMPEYESLPMLQELSAAERKEMENRKDAVYRWVNSKLIQK
jgi:hypothetical protein